MSHAHLTRRLPRRQGGGRREGEQTRKRWQVGCVKSQLIRTSRKQATAAAGRIIRGARQICSQRAELMTGCNKRLHTAGAWRKWRRRDEEREGGRVGEGEPALWPAEFLDLVLQLFAGDAARKVQRRRLKQRHQLICLCLRCARGRGQASECVWVCVFA